MSSWRFFFVCALLATCVSSCNADYHCDRCLERLNLKVKTCKKLCVGDVADDICKACEKEFLRINCECQKKDCRPEEYDSWAKDVAGAAVGAATPSLFFTMIGLGAAGPVAGGLFAANMGAAVAAGGVMAGLQAAGMAAMGSPLAPAAAAAGIGYMATKLFFPEEEEDPCAMYN
eukprot:m.30135 g.30135  ORF g.30135 m.30135 type:complete len:174 (+) comp8174_c0_seq1:558-1079(+)